MATDQTLQSYQITPSINHPLAGDDGSVGGNYPFFQVAQDVEAALRELSINTAWQQFNGLTGVVFVFVDATHFTMGSVDYTALWRVGSAVQAFVTAGTIYGIITASSFGGGLMSVTVEWRNGAALDAGLSEVRLSCVQADLSGSVPDSVLTQNNAPNYCAITNSGAAWTGTLVPPITAYKTGATYKFKFGAASQGSDTIALNGLSAISFTKNGTEALAANDVLAGQIVECVYDASGPYMQLAGGTVVQLPTTIPIKAYKAMDQAITSSAALTNDTDLSFAIAANLSFVFTFYLRVNLALANNNGGLNVAITTPSGATLFFTVNTLGGIATLVSGTAAFAIINDGTATDYVIVIEGEVTNGATPGTVQLQWCQNASNGEATTVKAGSSVTAVQVNP